MTKKNFQGHLLVANPNNPRDDLEKAVILLIGHGVEKVFGLQINNPYDDLNVQNISSGIGIELVDDARIYRGGSNNMGKISFIHSTDWSGLSTTFITEHLALTNDISVLTAISRGEGPEFYRACAGHWLWDRNQLDQQMDPHTSTRYKWEPVPATVETVFDSEGEEQWQTALEASARYQVSAWF